MEKRCALIGGNLTYSYSKVIHEMFAPYAYDLLAIPGEALAETLRDERYLGFNVTIPYKRAVLPLLDAIAPEARRIGAVNTVVRDGHRLVGYNTDYFGFRALARRTGVCFEGRRVLVLGSGGTSDTVRAVALDEGARSVETVSRTGPLNYENLYEHPAEILVNTTPAGMFPDNTRLLVDVGRIDALEGVLDVVYNPLRTRLVLSARGEGLRAAGGLFMLVMQAVAACERFTGTQVRAGVGEETFRTLRAQTENIVLVGMPGCGKTSVAQELARRTGRAWIDLDTEIERAAGRTIPEIFERFGEADFRRRESEAVEAAGMRAGVVIACGGGVVKTPGNLPALRQNGRIYWIQRERALLPTQGRPLSAGPDALKRLEREREPLYRMFSDAQVENSGTICDCAERILEDFYAAVGAERAKSEPAGRA